MSLRVYFGKQLKKIREENGLTQQELADLLEMQPNSIGQVEIGYKGVSFSTLEKLATKLNMDYVEFFNFNQSSTKSSLSKSIVNELDKLDLDTQRVILNFIRAMVKIQKK